MIDLEDAQAIQKLAAPVRKRVQARAKDHILLDPTSDRPFHQILGETRPDTHPPAERQDVRPKKLGAQSLAERRALLTSQPEREGIIEDHGGGSWR